MVKTPWLDQGLTMISTFVHSGHIQHWLVVRREGGREGGTLYTHISVHAHSDQHVCAYAPVGLTMANLTSTQ